MVARRSSVEVMGTLRMDLRAEDAGLCRRSPCADPKLKRRAERSTVTSKVRVGERGRMSPESRSSSNWSAASCCQCRVDRPAASDDEGGSMVMVSDNSAKLAVLIDADNAQPAII